MINQSIKNLNQVFADVILDKCKDKKVLLTLSGGMDTRAMLSVLLKNKIKFDALTFHNSHTDIKIAQSIATGFNLHHIIIPIDVHDKELRSELIKIFAKYDVVLYGSLMSELFNKYERFDISEAHIERSIDQFIDSVHNSNLPNIFVPAMEREVMDVLKCVPLYYRLFGHIQICIIKLNEPRLLTYPRTMYNLRLRTALYCYKIVVWLMGVAGYE